MTRPLPSSTRRRLLAAGLGTAAGLGSFARSARAQTFEQPFANGERRIVAYPEKRPLIVTTSRPPQLETPFEVFNEGVITPNDAFFVRYHNAGIPTSIDADKHVIKIGGNAAGKPFELTMADLRTQFKPVETRRRQPVLRQQPRLVHAARDRRPAGQRRDGQRALGRRAAEGRAGARRGQEHAPGRSPSTASTWRLIGGGDFVKALDVDHAMDGEVMLAYQMNGADMPMLNGYPVQARRAGLLRHLLGQAPVGDRGHRPACSTASG